MILRQPGRPHSPWVAGRFEDDEDEDDYDHAGFCLDTGNKL
jgi:hypothetical protein